MTDDQEAYALALEEAARRDPRFRAVPNPSVPGCFTYADPVTGEPELYPQGSTAEEAFATAYDLTPIFTV